LVTFEGVNFKDFCGAMAAFSSRASQEKKLRCELQWVSSPYIRGFPLLESCDAFGEWYSGLMKRGSIWSQTIPNFGDLDPDHPLASSQCSNLSGDQICYAPSEDAPPLVFILQDTPSVPLLKHCIPATCSCIQCV
jgi:hypothetical protein